METATPVVKDRGRGAGAIHDAIQVASTDDSQVRADLAARVAKCAGRAFDAIGASRETQEIVFWNLHMTRNLGREDIVDKPAQFVEGLKAIYGEAGELVFEYMMTKEIKSEFGLAAEFDKEPVRPRSLADLLHLVAYAALESSDQNDLVE